MLKAVALTLALSVAAAALTGCFRTGAQVGPGGAVGRASIPISL